ncbi:nucleoside-diphosphate sugar epimerase [Paenibacillus sp. GCM10027626]|uniref:nucleoside-diphosphate sugar epimerase n=1 Tax=Paenibacillus sp. GCM10027626 TaxID=3273411 RepID=UPI0036410DF5
MQHSVTELIEHMSSSHEQMARVLEAKRSVAVRMAQMVHILPDQNPDFGGMAGLMSSSQTVTASVVAYLNSIADLQETIATTIHAIMTETGEEEEKEKEEEEEE